MGLPLATFSFYDLGAGLDLKSSATKATEDSATLSLNVEYQIDGAVYTRNGSSIQNKVAGVPTPMSELRTLAMFDYKKSDGSQYEIFQAGGSIKKNFATPTNIKTGLDANAIPDFEYVVTNDDEYLIWGNGIDTNLKFDGTTVTNLSIATPIALTQNALAGGVLTGVYTYYVSYVQTVTGIIVQESDLSPVFSVTLAAQEIVLNVPVSADPQVNGRVIYRNNLVSGDIVRITPGVTIADNTTTTYTDNTPDASLSTVLADFTNQPAPTSAVFEEYNGRVYYVDAANPTDLYESKANFPWNVPTASIEILDGKINCLKRFYGTLLISTDRGTLWVQQGDFATGSLNQISSKIGVLNNRCAVGEGRIYILATNRKVYSLSPTDFAQKEIRIDNPISIKIEPLIAQIQESQNDKIAMEYYTSQDQGKVLISCPITASTNNNIIVFSETQSIQKGAPVWHLWDNINASALKQFEINGVINMFSGDYNGYLWKLDDNTIIGDGAEVNGTATSGSTTTLVDLTQAWTINAYRGVNLQTLTGTGNNQTALILSNTADTLTFAALPTAPALGTTYTIGGYQAYHFTNWKSVTGSYDTLKQLWFILANLNASGDYPIQLVIQYDFDTTTTNQTVINVNLQAANSIWGVFIWGQAVWGAQAVFQTRIREYERFRAVRFGFLNRKAGQPFQVNGFSLSVQDKQLFYGSAP